MLPRKLQSLATDTVRLGGSNKDENGSKNIFLYLFHPFCIYEKNTKIEREAGSDVFRPYLRDFIFNRNNPVLVPYL